MMADGTKATFDTSGWTAALDKLVGPARESLARSMAVAGGQVLRDEAKTLAPVQSGGLRDAIYLAYQDADSTPAEVRYAVSWNATKAPHGHLLEFGHWQTRAAYQGSDGKWYSGALLPNPKWVPAHPFLRPAYEAAKDLARQAMIERGKHRLPELLAGQGGDDEL
ncbi:HK97-gp10 family putative phage morphogenesis protein [Bordetella bronchialis]|nr:HK97-gp10 family putative phage morphogenesis protein [Bordetella bronchialis]